MGPKSTAKLGGAMDGFTRIRHWANVVSIIIHSANAAYSVFNNGELRGKSTIRELFNQAEELANFLTATRDICNMQRLYAYRFHGGQLDGGRR